MDQTYNQQMPGPHPRAASIAPCSWSPLIREWAALHNVELVATPTSASHFNRIECHVQPLREFVLNASDSASHAEVAVAFRRYLHRRNANRQNSRIRLLESTSRIA